MPNTVPAAGEAMPKDSCDRSLSGQIMDAQNILSEIKSLNEAIFMAASGIGNRQQMNAVATVTNIISLKLDDVEGMLDAARGAGE